MIHIMDLRKKKSVLRDGFDVIQCVSNGFNFSDSCYQ